MCLSRYLCTTVLKMQWGHLYISLSTDSLNLGCFLTTCSSSPIVRLNVALQWMHLRISRFDLISGCINICLPMPLFLTVLYMH
ncbi:unnamed protein product [Acanthoscelides obtectus]|uniref:Uncharacterized protein n=1 Tax=Acanthoscelides obtectus TaxID=200917 RepID=A0A9P0KYX0_ACAOB|nr:unnamed protein product [Acanthoscelides obtectus]CAK1642334.1 hypothetical protein AOBTE_LOCUS12982 [Acanthoscelides obtectus]